MKIGFIDYYIDEWHANHYPEWIKKASGGEAEVAYAWAKIDSPRGGRTTRQWCGEYGIEECRSQEEIIAESDALIVLSPDNCELHEELSRLALCSGKPVYIDKTFAPDAAAARRIFGVAESHGTPCWSSSALRFADEYRGIDPGDVRAVNCFGGGKYDVYLIHLLEPLMMLMKSPVGRVIACGNGDVFYNFTVEFADGRTACASVFTGGAPFVTEVCRASQNSFLEIKSDYFGALMAEICDFFKTRTEKVPHGDTIAVMALREACMKAAAAPGEWVYV